jgi:hypothetical protein
MSIIRFLLLPLGTVHLVHVLRELQHLGFRSLKIHDLSLPSTRVAPPQAEPTVRRTTTGLLLCLARNTSPCFEFCFDEVGIAFGVSRRSKSHDVGVVGEGAEGGEEVSRADAACPLFCLDRPHNLKSID